MQMAEISAAFRQGVALAAAKTVVWTENAVSSGTVELYDLYAADGDKLALLAAAAAAEQGADHPFSAALLAAAHASSLPFSAAEDVVYTKGRGISARVGEDVYFLGNKKAFRESGVPIPHAVRYADCRGHTVLYAAKNAAFCGFFLFRKAVRPEAAVLVQTVKRLGKRTVLLGRDRQAALLAAQLGIDETRITLLAREREKVLQEMQMRDRIILFDGIPTNAFCTVLAAAEKIMHPVRRRYRPPLWSASEETDMFGKVNYTMQINGMSCTHCSARVKTALESLRGVSAEISLEEKLARIKCPASMTGEKLAAAVTEVGFTVVSVERV